MRISDIQRKGIESDLPSVDASFDSYKSDRRFWQEISESATLSLNRSVITLSTSAIGFSLVMLTQVDNNPETWEFAFLVIAWISFLLAIHHSHLSYQYAQIVAQSVIEEEDCKYNRQNAEPAQKRRSEFDTKRSSMILKAQVMFYVGVFFTILFVAVVI